MLNPIEKFKSSIAHLNSNWNHWHCLLSGGSFPKADPRLPQDIAYIYEILHSNHFIILSNTTEYETTTINWCSYLIFSGIAENDEVVAVEDFIDVGNILGKIWVSLSKIKDILCPCSAATIPGNILSNRKPTIPPIRGGVLSAIAITWSRSSTPANAKSIWKILWCARLYVLIWHFNIYV